MTRHRLLAAFVTCVALSHIAHANTSDDVVWVSELESIAHRAGDEIIVEGRFQGLFGSSLDQIRLKGCNPEKVEFRLEPDTDRRLPSSLKFIRMNGTLTRSGSKLLIRVKSWSKINTTDEDRFREAARRIAVLDHRGWYALALRAQRLAEVYDEPELQALADEARSKGWAAEEAVLRPAQFAELLKLADRASDAGLDSDIPRRMRHKALRWRLDSLKAAKGTDAQWSELSDTIAKLLPGSGKPLLPKDSASLQRYRENPIEAYDSQPHLRDAGDRDTWVEAAGQAMLARAANPGADLAKLSIESARLLPERPELSRQFLRQAAEAEAASIKQWVDAARGASPPAASQVRRLADTFRTNLNDPQRGEQILRLWLDARSRRLSARDADGRVRLAKDYRTDLKDDESAAKLLLEAVQIEPELPEAESELKSLGYTKGTNGWTMNSANAQDRDSVGRRRQLPERNMTPDQVRAILGDPRTGDTIRFLQLKNGRPTVLEQWTYRGPPDLHVTFQYISPEDVRVIAINTPMQK